MRLRRRLSGLVPESMEASLKKKPKNEEKKKKLCEGKKQAVFGVPASCVQCVAGVV